MRQLAETYTRESTGLYNIGSIAINNETTGLSITINSNHLENAPCNRDYDVSLTM